MTHICAGEGAWAGDGGGSGIRRDLMCEVRGPTEWCARRSAAGCPLRCALHHIAAARAITASGTMRAELGTRLVSRPSVIGLPELSCAPARGEPCQPLQPRILAARPRRAARAACTAMLLAPLAEPSRIASAAGRHGQASAMLVGVARTVVANCRSRRNIVGVRGRITIADIIGDGPRQCRLRFRNEFPNAMRGELPSSWISRPRLVLDALLAKN